MKAIAPFFVVTLMLTNLANAQTQPSRDYSTSPRPPVVVNLGWGAMPQCRHASTAAESYARGWAAMVCAQGQYNLLSSAAAINAAQAREMELANRRDAVETYFDLRQKNEERRLAQLRKARTGGSSVREVSMTTPQGARRAAGPAMENGEIAWPAVLMSDDLAEHRIALERVSGVATGEITAQEQARAAEAAASLLAELKNRVAEVAPQEYVAAKKWLERVAR